MKKVLKFGGSSVAGADQIRKVVEIVKQQSAPCAVVVSALGGITDLLKKLAKEALNGSHEAVITQILDRHSDVIRELLSGDAQSETIAYCKERTNELSVICQGIHMLQELSNRSEARLMSFGELVSSYIVNEAVRSSGTISQRLDSRKLIITNDQLMKATVDMATTVDNIQTAFKSIDSVVIIPGFIASTPTGVTSTLGRGGSDYTAAIFAHAMEVETLEIWSDVSGMLTANPKAVTAVKNIAKMSYNEAFELSHFGAKVLYPPAIQPAYEKDIPVVLKNTFEPQHPGTTIDKEVNHSDQIVTGISSIDEVAMVNLTGIGMVGVSGYSSRVFNALHRHQINVVMIAQSCSERGICVAVDRADLQGTHDALNEAFENEISSGRVDPIKLESDLSIVALVGDGMKYRSGVSGRIFSVLGDYGINIRAIAQGSSESNISIIVNSSDEKITIQQLHASFFEQRIIPVHLFVAGVGTVGKTFIELIGQQKLSIIDKTSIQLTIHGLANSRTMLLRTDGINPDDAVESLKQSKTKADLQAMVEFAKNLKVPNKVFVDNTASPMTAPFYLDCMQQGIHVVTCNKIVASEDLVYFNQLQQLHRSGKAKFYFETNVGAALPVIRTIADMRRSGDEIHRIQAVVSGSLNYIYDAYDGSISFEEVVRKAGELGYTEPNPMDDLSGTDVMRKLVIVARAVGENKRMDDVIRSKDMPDACLNAKTVEEVYTGLKNSEDQFKVKLDQAHANDNKLKYVAEFNEGNLTVGLMEIEKDHPFYSLQGTDNMIAIYSKRYPVNPLVIQGAGAGAEQTASGVLSDILNIDFVS